MEKGSYRDDGVKELRPKQKVIKCKVGNNSQLDAFGRNMLLDLAVSAWLPLRLDEEGTKLGVTTRVPQQDEDEEDIT